MRKNGFSCPWNFQQIITISAFAINKIIFYLFTINLITSRGQRFQFILFFSCWSIVSILMSILTASMNPADNLLKKEIGKKNLCKEQNKKYVLEISKNFDFCVICCSNVSNNSKHCKICNKCVEKFDHHCNWLNNCIGEQNYFCFFALLWVLFTNLSYNIAIYAYAAAAYLNKDEDEERLMLENSSALGISLEISFGFTLFNALLNFFVFVNVVYLICVHIWLRCKGLTTYEYIVDKLAKQELKIEETLERKNDHSENAVLKVKSDFKNFKKFGFGSDASFNRNNVLSGGVNESNNDNNNENNMKNGNNSNLDIDFAKNSGNLNNNGVVFSNLNNINNSKKKGKNKILPENLILKIRQNEFANGNPINGINLKENSDKFIIDGKEYQEKLFKPIVDEIYNLNNNVKRINVAKSQQKIFDFSKANNDSTANNKEIGNIIYLKQTTEKKIINEDKSISLSSNPIKEVKKDNNNHNNDNFLVENIFENKEIGNLDDLNILESCKGESDLNTKKALSKLNSKYLKTNESYPNSNRKNLPSSNRGNVSVSNNTNFLRQSSIRELNNSTFIKEK